MAQKRLIELPSGGGLHVFLGTHFPKIDDKGRLVLPAKFREGLAEGVVLSKGQDRSVVVWGCCAPSRVFWPRPVCARRCDSALPG